jgi:hypothetical protein
MLKEADVGSNFREQTQQVGLRDHGQAGLPKRSDRELRPNTTKAINENSFENLRNKLKPASI